MLALAAAMMGGCGSKNKGNGQAGTDSEAGNIPVDTALRHRLSDFAALPRPAGAFGFHVYDLTAEKPVYGCNEDTVQPSASCLKLLSGIAGLHLLGTKYLYTTSLYTKGVTKDGTFKGDISFKAGLDPQVNEPDLDMFARALRRKGIRKLDGRLVIDLVLTTPVQSEVHWYPWDLAFSRYGLFYRGAERVEKALKHALRTAGISIDDEQVVRGRTPRGSHCIFRFYRSIDRVIDRMWKNSSNTQATALLYTIGHYYDPKQAPAEAGLAYLRHFMRKNLQLKDTALVIHDGCGLCTQNQLSPDALVIILRYGYAHPAIYGQLQRNLSTAGVDGTLHSLLRSDKLKGKIHGKTGTLSHPYGISSLAGYATGSNGHLLAFAIMDHQMSVLDARVLQRELCTVLVDKP